MRWTSTRRTCDGPWSSPSAAGAACRPIRWWAPSIVRDGEVVGEGWHEGPGTDHAEVMALRAAGARARGAIVYSTLEPCNRAGRTPAVHAAP